MTARGKAAIIRRRILESRKRIEREEAVKEVTTRKRRYKTDRTRALLRRDERLGPARKGFVAQARSLMEIGRAVFSTELADDAEFMREFAKVLKQGALALDPDSMKIVAGFLKVEQHEHRHTHELIRSLGVDSEDEARRIIGESKSLEGITDHESFARLLDWGEMYLNQNPDQREMAVRRWGGVILREAERV